MQKYRKNFSIIKIGINQFLVYGHKNAGRPNNSAEMIKAVKCGLMQLFRQEYVWSPDIVPEWEVQGGLFDSTDHSQRNNGRCTQPEVRDEHGTSGSSGTLENNVYASGEPVSLLLDPVDGCDNSEDMNCQLT